MTTNCAHSDFDIETLADKVVTTLSVSAGQVIWIWASTHSLDLIEALAYRIRERGAFWVLRLTIESLLQRIGQSVPESYLELIPRHELSWLKDVDAIVSVRDHKWHPLDVSLARRRAMGGEWRALIDEANRRGIRIIKTVNPTPVLASAYGIPLASLRQAYWQAIDIDHESLDRQQQKVRARLAKTKQVHISSALGTDLHLQIDQRPVHLDENDIPRGEVYVAPHEDSTDGVAVIDKTFIKGRLIERLRLTFSGGRVVQVEAPNQADVAAFKELLSASSGDKDVIAEFAIGLNPGAREPTGDIQLDEKIGGSVHIAIGMNENFGGKNRANLHLDMVLLRPSVWLDDSPILVNGTLDL